MHNEKNFISCNVAVTECGVNLILRKGSGCYEEKREEVALFCLSVNKGG